MRCRFGLFVLLVCVASAEAQDRPGSAPPARGVRADGHFGDFFEPPPEEDDTVFTVDTGSGLDTGCTFRRNSPLVIQLPVRRFVGEVRGDGTLEDSDSLASAGLLSRHALLSLPVFDIDEEGNPNDPSVPPEVDRITFNGHDLDRPLTGSNERWKLNTFRIDIDWVKFPRKGAAPAVNEIRIHIDERSPDTDRWCTAVDWVALEFQAVAPVFLVHGILSEGASWNETGFTKGLQASLIPYSDAINLPKAGSIEANGRALAAELQRVADRFGAKRCHIIAHSKGGLDTRAYLQGNNYKEKKLKVVSVYTLSTPHRGSPVADVGVALAIGGAIAVRNPRLLTLLRNAAPAIPDLTTVHMLAFNRDYPAPPVPFVSYGADADLNDDGVIDTDEAEPYLSFPATVFYRIVGNADRVIVLVPVPIEWGDWHFGSISIPVQTPFVPNDTLVSETSARFGSYVNTEPGRNHTTLKSSNLARRIVADIIRKEGIR